MTATTRRPSPPGALLGDGQPVGVAEHRRGVAVLDPVVLGLGPGRVARHARRPGAAWSKPGGAAGDDLVDVGLVAGVPQEDVLGASRTPGAGRG